MTDRRRTTTEPPSTATPRQARRPAPGRRIAMPVQLQVGGRWLPATAHASRVGRRGAQVLIGCHSRLFWVPAERVRPRTEGAGTEEATSA